jgi:hypothetical protein
MNLLDKKSVLYELGFKIYLIKEIYRTLFISVKIINPDNVVTIFSFPMNI